MLTLRNLVKTLLVMITLSLYYPSAHAAQEAYSQEAIEQIQSTLNKILEPLSPEERNQIYQRLERVCNIFNKERLLLNSAKVGTSLAVFYYFHKKHTTEDSSSDGIFEKLTIGAMVFTLIFTIFMAAEVIHALLKNIKSSSDLKSLLHITFDHYKDLLIRSNTQNSIDLSEEEAERILVSVKKILEPLSPQQRSYLYKKLEQKFATLSRTRLAWNCSKIIFWLICTYVIYQDKGVSFELLLDSLIGCIMVPSIFEMVELFLYETPTSFLFYLPEIKEFLHKMLPNQSDTYGVHA